MAGNRDANVQECNSVKSVHDSTEREKVREGKREKEKEEEEDEEEEEEKEREREKETKRKRPSDKELKRTGEQGDAMDTDSTCRSSLPLHNTDDHGSAHRNPPTPTPKTNCEINII